MFNVLKGKGKKKKKISIRILIKIICYIIIKMFRLKKKPFKTIFITMNVRPEGDPTRPIILAIKFFNTYIL